MLAGSPMPSVICKMSQSLLRNTRFICTLFTACYDSQSSPKFYMSWKLTGTTYAKEKKSYKKEMKRK